MATILREEKKECPAPWFFTLNDFLMGIQTEVNKGTYIFKNPLIIGMPKEPGKISKIDQYRPICLFSIKDRIVLNALNKFLTEKVDPFLSPVTFSFRSKNKTLKHAPNHHDCIRKLVHYLNSNPEKILYTARCDIKQFFDTINHDIVLDKTNLLFEKAFCKEESEQRSICVSLIKSFLKSYSFNQTILSKTNRNRLKSLSRKITFRLPDELVQLKLEKAYTGGIGIAQGASISGLLTNILLSDTDYAMHSAGDLVLRYCDDILIVTDSEKACQKKTSLLMSELKKLQLIPHPYPEKGPVYDVTQMASGKSKGPSAWLKSGREKDQWIQFLGYDIHASGSLRIRPGSLKKEIDRIRKIRKKTVRAIANATTPRDCDNALQNAIYQMTMLTGAGMKNNRINCNGTRLQQGFRELRFNKESAQQMKVLDKIRTAATYKLFRLGNFSREIKPSRLFKCSNYFLNLKRLENQ